MISLNNCHTSKHFCRCYNKGSMKDKYDVIIIGGGPTGLVSFHYRVGIRQELKKAFE